VAEQDYTLPTPVQARAIPILLAGRDLMATAQTGTGKTAGFALPILQLLAGRPARRRSVRALVLEPTRELAAQVAESFRAYGSRLPLRCVEIFGGVGMQPQVDALRRGVEIVVATPGRLLDHAGGGTIDLSAVEILVLDEADRMLDMGFIHDIKRVLALLPGKRQNMLVCATYTDEIKELAYRFLDRPELVEVARRNSTADRIQQSIVRVDRERKAEALAELIAKGRWSQVLVFTRTKHGANRLAEKLSRGGVEAEAIHGNKSQGARTRALSAFKDGQLRVLVATELAARGLDIEGLPHVVNFELPFVPEDYVHRIGRTARAGASGDAVSLVCIDEEKLLHDIERVIGHRLPVETLPGFEPDPRIAPEPILRGGLGRRGPGRQGGPRREGSPSPVRRPPTVHQEAEPPARPQRSSGSSTSSTSRPHSFAPRRASGGGGGQRRTG